MRLRPLHWRAWNSIHICDEYWLSFSCLQTKCEPSCIEDFCAGAVLCLPSQFQPKCVAGCIIIKSTIKTVQSTRKANLYLTCSKVVLGAIVSSQRSFPLFICLDCLDWHQMYICLISIFVHEFFFFCLFFLTGFSFMCPLASCSFPIPAVNKYHKRVIFPRTGMDFMVLL